MSLHFDPPFLPLHTTLLAVLAAGAASILYLHRELRSRSERSLLLVGLRIGLVLALAFILLNPVIVARNETPKGKRPFLLLLDTSRSMTTNDVAEGSRYAAALKATLENDALMAALAERYDLHIFAFSDRPEASHSEALRKLQRPNGNRTNIGAALAGAANALGGKQSDGGGEILLISDGRDTSDSLPLEAARALKASGYTLSTLCVGRQTRQRDLQVVARKTQVFASPGQEVRLVAEVVNSGLPRTRTRVELMRDGHPVTARDVVVEPGRTEVDFPVRQLSKGFYRYAIQVASILEEPNTANNRANIFLSVTNDRVRVLFLEGRPSWDSKFLAQALRSDPTVMVDVIYKLTDTRFFAVIGGSEKEEGIAVPRTPEQMSQYDIIIFGKGFEEFYDQAGVTALKEWIATRGGNVVFLRGRSDERTAALRDIEPVAWSDQELGELRMRLTEEGRTHPGFAFPISEDAQTVVKRLPPLVSATRVQGEKALAVVLARADDAESDRDVREMATLAYQRYGQGKVMAIVGQGLWRWAMLPPELEGYRKVYQEFWTQTVRWMVSESDFLPGQNIAVKTDRTSYAPDETVHFRGYIRSNKSTTPPTLSLALPNGKTVRLVSARGDGNQADFTATFRPTLPGEYVVSIESADGKAVPVATHFTVNPGHEEDLNRSADPDLMRQLAAIGGGQTYSLHDIGDLPQQLKTAELARERKTDPRTAWDRPWVLMALMALLGAEWWLRRKSGLA